MSQTISSLYWGKEITQKVYKNVMNLIKIQYNKLLLYLWIQKTARRLIETKMKIELRLKLRQYVWTSNTKNNEITCKH